MSVLDVNREVTEDSLKAIGFFKADYDLDIKEDGKWIKIPSYLKFIPYWREERVSKFGPIISIRYTPYLKSLDLNITNTPLAPFYKSHQNVVDIDELNCLIHEYINEYSRHRGDISDS